MASLSLARLRANRVVKEGLAMHRTLPGLSLAVVLLAGCNYPLASTASGLPEAWIDAPLNGTTLPLGPVEVVWHAAALEGVAQVEFGINGSPMPSAPPDNAGGSFVMGKQGWVPAAAGNYILHVRAQDKGGTWGPVASVAVTVLDTEQLLPSASPTPTESAPESPTPTVTPRATATSTPTTQVSIERVRISTDRVAYEGGSSCAPMEVTILYRAIDPAGIKTVVLFYRLRNSASGEATDYFSQAMVPQDGDLYSIVINPAEDIISHVGFPGSGEAWLQYQAVIQNNRGDTSTRTPLLSDITVLGC